MQKFIVNENDAGRRLDKLISKFCPSLPTSLMYKYIRKKRIKVNGKKAELNDKLIVGDVVELFINDEFFENINAQTAFMKVKPKLDIVYEDENIIIVNKPCGMVVHEDEGEKLNTLISHIQKYLYDKGEYDPELENTFAPALCNRIDRNTTGLVIAAKNAPTLRIINQKIKDREIKKYYYCIVKGEPNPKQSVLKAYLTKDSSKNQVTIYPRPMAGAKTIITAYKVIKSNFGSSLVEVELITGRTHQIRAHFAYIGHPLAGDAKYGDPKYNQATGRKFQALCAYKLIFNFNTPSEHLEYLNGKTISLSPQKSGLDIK